MTDFFNMNCYDLENVKSEEFNYRRKIAVSFAVQKSYLDFNDFTEFRKKEVDKRQWFLIKEYEFDFHCRYNFTVDFFKFIKSGYLKALFILEIAKKKKFLVITVVSPAEYFKNKKSFIHEMFKSLEILKKSS